MKSPAWIFCRIMEEGEIEMRKKKGMLVLGMVTTITLSACQNSPDSSIVKNKDFDNMIEEAQNTENGSASVADIGGNYDTYQTTLKDDSLHVSVNVDAKVDIPETSRMSVMRIRQKKIDQELLDKVKEELVQGKTLYDGSVLSVKTRSSIEEEIGFWKSEMNSIEANPDGAYDEESIQAMKEEYQQSIDELQAEYENTPSEVSWEDYSTDGKLHGVAELYERDTQNEFYSWERDLNPNGDVFYAVSDGKDGNYTSLYVQNNEDYGNCLRYYNSRHGYAHVSSVTVGEGCDFGRWNPEDGISKENLLLDISEDDLKEYTDVPTTIPQEQAIAQADNFLEHIGLAEFQYAEGGLYCEIPTGEAEEDGKIGYRKVYILRYLRNIDGVFVSNDGGMKRSEGWDGDDYVKMEWPGEYVEILINDEGITGFSYNAPIETVETVVDQSSMKSFDEIRDIFEQMVIVANAKEEDSEVDNSVSIDVDRVMLRYTRISEEGSFDTGLLVPVWDFMGTISSTYGEAKDTESDACVLTINAIDGSVIDRELGY